jgi:hypothetical protein
MEHGATADGLPAFSRPELQKAMERAYLQRFRENFADFPEGAILPNEHPDFLVETRRGHVGIELIEYHVQEPDEGRGSTTRAREGTEDKVLRMAAEQYRSKSLPPVVVSVLWHPHQALDSRRIPELAIDLADLVQENLPEAGRSVTIRDRHHPLRRSLPQEVASLTVVRRNSISKGSWTPVRAAFVPTITPPDLQRIMLSKEAKAPSYLQHCREVWLLIVARGSEPSTFGEIGPEVEGYRFDSGFDRVFFLHYFDGSVSELHVRR